MQRTLQCRFLLAVIFAAALGQSSIAQFALAQSANPPDLLREYRFIPADTTVHVSGGAQNYNLNLTIAGRFGLVTGYDEEVTPVSAPPSLTPHAEFVDVHGILFNPLSAAALPLPGWDLDKTLNLSGLNGTFIAGQPDQLFFLGGDGAGVALRLEADIKGRWLHLTGGSSDPPGSKAVLYQIDALAHLGPFPDFNGDGLLTDDDVSSMMQALTNPTQYVAAHGMTADDLNSLADANGDGKLTNDDLQAMLSEMASGNEAVPNFSSTDSPGAVPEPASCALAVCGLAGLFAFSRWRK